MILITITLILVIVLFLFSSSSSDRAVPSPYCNKKRGVCLPVRQTTPQVLGGGLTIFTGADAWFN